MLKALSFKLLFLPAFFLLGIFGLSAISVPKAKAEIPKIGDLELGETKTIKVDRLFPNTKYYWKVSRVSNIRLRQYEEIYHTCITTVSDNVIENQLGPFHLVGLYKLEIYQAQRSATECKESGRPAQRKDFSVGGATGKSCCVHPYPRYNLEKNFCETNSAPSTSRPTECSKIGASCEFNSLQCFTTSSIPGGLPGTTSGGGKIIRENACTLGGGNEGLKTALGCIPIYNLTEFVKWFLGWAIGIAGGIAFLLILSSGFQIMTSSGNPDKLKGGQEQLTAAISGLLFIIFSVFLLRLIGVDILQLPGFGR